MARYIHCPTCKEQMEKSASRYKEYYEAQEGTAQHHMLCDGCGKGISPDDLCFASVLFDSKDHRNYEKQKPSQWSDGYINIKTTA